MIRHPCPDCGSLCLFDTRQDPTDPQLCEYCRQHRAAAAKLPLFDRPPNSAKPPGRPKRKPPANPHRHPAEGGPSPLAKE